MLKQRATILFEVITGALLFTVLHAPVVFASRHAEALNEQTTEQRSVENSESKTPLAASPEEKKKKEQQKRLSQLQASLKNSGRASLAETLKNNLSLKDALNKGNDKKLADELGLEMNDPQIQQLKARNLVESDIKKFSDEFKKLEEKGYASNDYEKALLAETKKLVKRHQPMVDLLASRTGNSPGALAGRLESWDQLVDNKGRSPSSEDGKKVAKQMAGFLRSVGDRGGLETEIKQAIEKVSKGSNDKPENRLLSYFEMGTALTNRFPQDPQSRLTNIAGLPSENSVEGQFARQLLNEWPQHVQAMKDFGKLRDAAIQVGANGRYIVDPKAMAELKEKFPTLNQEWANAVGDKKSLWGAGFDTTKGEWSFITRQNLLDPSFNLIPPALRATNSLALQQFLDQKPLDQKPNGAGPTNLSSLANAAAAQNRMQFAQSQLASVQSVMRILPGGVQNFVQSSVAGLNHVYPQASSLNLDEMFSWKISGKSTEDKLQDAAGRLAKVFGADVQVSHIRDFNGVPIFQIRAGNTQEKAEKAINTLVKARTQAGLSKDDLPFSSDDKGNILIYGGKIMNYWSGAPDVIESTFKRLEDRSNASVFRSGIQNHCVSGGSCRTRR